jgi:hypothetical protein
MKHSSKRTSGKAAAALSQPQQTARAEKEPTAEQIKETLQRYVDNELDQFNAHLEIARRIWRGNRKLVESPRYPEPWRAIAVKSDGAAPIDREIEIAPTVEQLRKRGLRIATEIATKHANAPDGQLSPATNLLNENGYLQDPPTTLYVLLAQRFEDGKDLEFLQDVLLTYDENWKLRRYLAELRGLIPAKDAA